MSRALAVGSPEFNQATRDEQQKAEACKRLLKNSIVCWNYLYLTQLLAKTKNPKKKDQLIEMIKKTSIFSWEHLNFTGLFDFTDNHMKDSLGFNLNSLLKVKLPGYAFNNDAEE